MSQLVVNDAIHAIEVRPDTVGLTHAKILRDEVVRLRRREEELTLELAITKSAASKLVRPEGT